MQRSLVTQASERGKRVQVGPFERVGARTVGDENDYGHADGTDVDMPRRKAGRERRGKSDFGPLRSLASEPFTRLHSPHGIS